MVLGARLRIHYDGQISFLSASERSPFPRTFHSSHPSTLKHRCTHHPNKAGTPLYLGGYRHLVYKNITWRTFLVWAGCCDAEDRSLRVTEITIITIYRFQFLKTTYQSWPLKKFFFSSFKHKKFFIGFILSAVKYVPSIGWLIFCVSFLLLL